MFYVLAVVVAAYSLPRAPSVVTAFGAVTALNFFFVPPRWTFEVWSREHLISVFAMLAVALVISRLAAALRREAEVAHINEGSARQLQQLATALASATRSEEVIASGQKVLDAAFDGPCIIAVLERGEIDAPPALRDGMLAACARPRDLGPGTGRWPGLNAWYLPLKSEGNRRGGLRPEVPAARHQRPGTCAGHLRARGQALWRMKLAASVHVRRGAVAMAQGPNTSWPPSRMTFRTPLATIMAAASALEMQRESCRRGTGPAARPHRQRGRNTWPPDRKHAAAGAAGERRRAARRTGNPWRKSRRGAGRVRRATRTDASARSVPRGLPLIKGDPVLLAHCWRTCWTTRSSTARTSSNWTSARG